MVRDYVKSGPHYERGRPRLWNKKIFGSQPKFTPYADWMDGGDGFRKALSDLDELGLIFLSGVPQSESAVEDIVSKVGHLQSTFYGLTWDVISKPDAENVAYTNEFLGLHHDLMYIDSTPEIQILHCLDNDAEGGESLFSDGLRAALEVRHTAPDQFHSLSTVLVPYKYAAGSNHYRSALPVFDLVDGKVRAINWSPPFQDVFHRKVPTADGGWRARETPAARLAKWWSAAKAFKDNLEAPENMLEYKLRPGECVLFNNRRVLHGRRHFDLARGRRWLKGGYIEHKVFLSKLEDSGVIEENPLRGLPEEDVQARAILGLPLDEGPAEAAEATSAGKPGGKAKGGDNSARQVSDQSIETTSAEEARWGSDRDGNPRPIIRFVDPKGYGKGPRKSKRPEGGPAVESQA
ncbi:Gamma-butyrobetaine dioxygenase [Pleurostoma richardsiae]|uniref:Gamma-butyrobetaine dioxygenase n=1 Tax=Pleurostoma richardsiae TaxID=41990 RepID=A0AA38VED5_9PEZI|nr:Gamma-butyrobetaine dioxygenase [Pleurostoma richardsiae]